MSKRKTKAQLRAQGADRTVARIGRHQRMVNMAPPTPRSRVGVPADHFQEAPQRPNLRKAIKRVKQELARRRRES